jgi:hypothetical protein
MDNKKYSSIAEQRINETVIYAFFTIGLNALPKDELLKIAIFGKLQQNWSIRRIANYFDVPIGTIASMKKRWR